MKNPKTIMVVKKRAMGDAVMGLATVQWLKEVYPKSKVYYATPAWIAPLFEMVDVAADGIIPLKLDGLSDAWQLLKTIRSLRVDWVHECQQSGSTKKFFSVASKLLRFRYTAHNHHLGPGESKVFDQGVIKPNIQRDLDGAWSFTYGHFPHPNHLEFPPHLGISGPNAKLKQVVVGVVATRESKQYPIELMAQLLQLLAQQNLEVLVPLGPGDRELKQRLLELGAQDWVKWVEVPLEELPIELSSAKYYVGNDTGLKHLCAALGLPTYTLFGPEPPLEWHPYDTQKHPYYFRDPLECRTRTAHFCPLSTCESMICLNELSPAQIVEQLEQFA